MDIATIVGFLGAFGFMATRLPMVPDFQGISKLGQC